MTSGMAVLMVAGGKIRWTPRGAWGRLAASWRRRRCGGGRHAWGTAIAYDAISDRLEWVWVCTREECGHTQPVPPWRGGRRTLVPW